MRREAMIGRLRMSSVKRAGVRGSFGGRGMAGFGASRTRNEIFR